MSSMGVKKMNELIVFSGDNEAHWRNPPSLRLILRIVKYCNPLNLVDLMVIVILILNKLSLLIELYLVFFFQYQVALCGSSS